MEGFITDWLNLAIRWFHVVAAIAWIGESFYFVALDNSLKPPQDPNQRKRGVFGELWHVHGGGFYNMQKYTVAPPEMPDDLHWSKWPSYTTWLSGFGLFTVLYLFSPSTYLIDKNVLDMGPVVAVASALGFLAAGWIVYDSLCRMLGNKDKVLGICVGVYVLIAAWLACHIFAGRAAYLIMGAMLATIMSANVFFVIIPGQRKMVDAMLKGDTPNPIYGKRGKQRSVHNTYFTLPVVFAMLSNHYAMTYTHPYNWAVLVVIMLGGALIRQFFVMRHRGQVLWYLPLAGIALMFGALFWTMPRPVVPQAQAANAPTVKLADIAPVLQQRCAACHSAHPTMMGSAPAGVMLDTPDEISQNAQRIYQQAVTLKAMPLGNVTHMTDDERMKIAAWFEGGAAK
ncbi:urate hydroxylase PuuD [Paraburkholderia phenoliruptrix]|uniref:urate hydroxylase PuuD n=1 Tax=Paraburkholderia phenoliruptrix TaxID=252970 RepID=UPI001C6E68B2|nr:urate hydroxylase PuuD [Paraburkholderia phenoliruptrix]MBW9108024.1 urate hydroxylase PuuD [Paraburkholderia phenoliruptrix]MBW9133328.1 urate hydroxylase PuuD [Paraburkholderia ginsengiterrae]